METREVFESVVRLQALGVPYALVTVVRAQPPASARPGDKAIVTGEAQIIGWIGGGCAQPAVLRSVRAALHDGQARLIRIGNDDAGYERDMGDVLEFGMTCHSGGKLELFVEPVLPRVRLVVIGQSPVAASLVRLAPQVGFAVTVVAQDQPVHDVAADRVFDSDDLDVVAPQIAPGAWVVVATQGRRDLQGLRLALAVGARQISFVASARKARVLKDSLRAAGASSAAVESIVAPAGYPIAATTPEEIALSVLAAVVAHRRGASGGEVPSRNALADDAQPRGIAADHDVQKDALAPSATASCCGSARADVSSEGSAREVKRTAKPGTASCCGD